MSRTYKNDGTSEKEYLHLIRHITANGIDCVDRTGTGTRKVHGYSLRFDLSDGTIPLLTTKHVPWKHVFHELKWFLSGDTNIQPLLKNKVTIWSEWPHKAYKKATGNEISLEDFEAKIVADDDFAQQWGSIGPGYGHQWRHWQGPDGKVYDQVSEVIKLLRTDPNSRRALWHGWNVADLSQMQLPPCHLLYQFFVGNGRLSLTMYQRSCDVGLGLPFNLASCAFLLRMMAQQCGLKPGELFWVGHDVHLYSNHIEPIAIQLDRKPQPFPQLLLPEVAPPSLFDYELSDFTLLNYNPQPSIKLQVAV